MNLFLLFTPHIFQPTETFPKLFRLIYFHLLVANTNDKRFRLPIVNIYTIVMVTDNTRRSVVVIGHSCRT